MAVRSIDMEHQMVAGLRRKDRQAQFEAYKRYCDAMFNTACRILQNEMDAEDVLQESFLAAFTRIEQYTGEATFGAWLKRIVVNKSINALNQKKANLLPLEEALLGKIAEDGEESTLIWNVDQVMQAVDNLPDGYRVVFCLYLLEGYDHMEIAQILGITEGGSKSQLNRAKQKVREILTAQSYV